MANERWEPDAPCDCLTVFTKCDPDPDGDYHEPECGCPEVYEFCPVATVAVHFLGCDDDSRADRCSEAA